MKGLKGRYYCFTIVVRLNQIEVAPNVYLGFDESGENTPENLKSYREAIARAFPEGRITIAFSHSALSDESENYQTLRKLAKEYHERFGDDVTYVVGGYFAGAYCPRSEINGHIDEAFALLEKFMGRGYRPKAVIGGFLPAAVLEHLAECGVHSAQGNIFSQYCIDNQDGEGSICYPYYPSKEHFCKPAQGREDMIDCVNFDGWTVDFINATYCGVTKAGYNSRMGFGPIETLRPYGHKKGIEVMLATADQMLGESYLLNGEFGFITHIWELCLIQKNGSHAMDIDGDTVYEFLSALKNKFPDVQMVTYGELGDKFRAAYPDNSQLDYRFRHRGIGIGGSMKNREITWYMNGRFRLACMKNLTTGQKSVIDFTDYTKHYAEPEDSDYRKHVLQRNWSIYGDINQKGLRPQDRPVPVHRLPEEIKEKIGDIYPELIS